MCKCITLVHSHQWCKVQFKPFDSLWDCKINPFISATCKCLSNLKQTLNLSIVEAQYNFRIQFTLFTNLLLLILNFFFFWPTMSCTGSGLSKSKVSGNSHKYYHLSKRTWVLIASFIVNKDSIWVFHLATNLCDPPNPPSFSYTWNWNLNTKYKKLSDFKHQINI